MSDKKQINFHDSSKFIIRFWINFLNFQEQVSNTIAHIITDIFFHAKSQNEQMDILEKITYAVQAQLEPIFAMWKDTTVCKSHFKACTAKACKIRTKIIKI